MQSIQSFIQQPKNMRFEGENDDEQILYVLRRSHLTNISWVLGLIIMIAIPLIAVPILAGLKSGGQSLVSLSFIGMVTLSWYLAVFGLWLFNFLNWYFNIYIITSDKIIDFDFYGLTYKNISETIISNIEDVTANISGPINMIFNIGDVLIQTAAETHQFEFSQIDKPGKVRDIISDLIVKRQGNANS